MKGIMVFDKKAVTMKRCSLFNSEKLMHFLTGFGFCSAADKKISFISTPPFLMAQAAIDSLFIINKSGGLIYYKVYSWFPYLFFYICKYEEPAHFSRIMVQLGGWTPMTVLDWQVSGIQCMLSPNNSPLSLVVLALTSYKPITSIFTASNPSQVCKLLYS